MPDLSAWQNFKSHTPKWSCGWIMLLQQTTHNALYHNKTALAVYYICAILTKWHHFFVILATDWLISIFICVWSCNIQVLQQACILHRAIAWVYIVCLGTTVVNWSAIVTKQVAEKGCFRDDIQCRRERKLLQWVYRRAKCMVVYLPFSPAVKSWDKFLLPLQHLSASQEVLW